MSNDRFYPTTLVLVLFFLAVAFGTCFFAIMAILIRNLWNSRGFYPKEFEQYSTEARALAFQTMRIRREIDYETTANLATQTANKELLDSADEWDTGINLTLVAWRGFLHPEQVLLGTERVREGDRMMRKRRKAHSRYVIGLMRARCKEGIRHRNSLSAQLQALEAEISLR